MSTVRSASYRSDIDGLRAIAIIPVVLFHARVAAFGGGYLGVDVFFVISGFLITSLIGREIADGRFTYVSFWERRARRLLPAMFLVVAVSSAVAYFVLLPQELKAFGQSVLSISVFSSNVYFWLKAGYFAAPAQTVPLLHTWSLAVEEQFYLLFPAVLIALSRVQPARRIAAIATIGCVSFAISVWWVKTSPSAAYYLLPSRGWELMLGATLALLRSDRARAATPIRNDALLVLGLAMILIPVFVYRETTPFPGFAALVPCLGTALIIWIGNRPSRIGRLLDNRAMVLVGELSYSIYLWHWPLLVFFSMVRQRPLSSLTGVDVASILAVTVALSWITFVLVENPIRRRRAFGTRGALFTAVGSAAAALAAFGITMHVGQGFERRIPEAALRIADGVHDGAREWNACNDLALDKVDAADLCRLGARDREATAPQFLLWGDSYAQMLYPAVDRAAKDSGVVGLHASQHSCPPITGIEVSSQWAVECFAFNRRIEVILEHGRFAAVILAAHWSAYARPGQMWTVEPSDAVAQDDTFRTQLRKTIDALIARGIAVFVVDEVPYPAEFQPAQFARAVWWGADPNSAGITVTEYRQRVTPFTSRLPVESRFEHISPLRSLCPDGVFCPAIIDGTSLYIDDIHLTTHGAARMVDAFRDAFAKVTWR